MYPVFTREPVEVMEDWVDVDIDVDMRARTGNKAGCRLLYIMEFIEDLVLWYHKGYCIEPGCYKCMNE